jgi:predicted phosphodiesterase
VLKNKIPPNWKKIEMQEEPIVDINGYKFFIHPNLASILLQESEVEMNRECLEIQAQYPEISYILYGGSNETFLMGAGRVRILNPGDAVQSRNFAVVYLPVTQITFGSVPVDPLPSLVE